MKRNLFWIVGGVVSVGMIIVAVLFSSSAKVKADASLDALSAYTNTVNKLKDATPYPSPETIAKVDNDALKVEGFSKEAESLFAYEKPRRRQPQKFKVHLINSLVALHTEATNHNVRLPVGVDFNFTFSHLLSMPNLLPCSVAPLAERLQDVQDISRILFESRVHAIDSFARVPGWANEQGGRVLMHDVGIRTNLSTEAADFTSTPYRISFRGFTSELTEVLNRFACADRFYVVRQIEVQATQPAEASPVRNAAWQRGGLQDASDDPSARAGGNLRTMRDLLNQARISTAARGVAQQTLETIVDERPLRISMMIDVVKLVPKAARNDHAG
ncbi:MAG: hypothetical protein ACPGVU_20855 [Limisphaerales bacterium]